MSNHPHLRRWYWRWHVEIGFVVVAVCLIVGGVSIVTSRNDLSRQAQLGAQSHRALCALRADYARRVAESRRFLNETRAERIKEFGPALGAIPPASVRVSLANQVQTLRTLGALRC
jgi:hypothetical protein